MGKLEGKVNRGGGLGEIRLGGNCFGWLDYYPNGSLKRQGNQRGKMLFKKGVERRGSGNSKGNLEKQGKEKRQTLRKKR